MSGDALAGWSGTPAGAEPDGAGINPVPPAPASVHDDLVLLERADATLSAVELALRRLDDGSYGTCEVCCAELSAGELEAAPALSRCPQHAG